MTRTEFNPAKLGAFVIGALLLAVIAIILWGPLNNLWQKKYVIFFDETSKGLEAGATVRLNGVSIGNVNSIDLFYDQTNKVYSAVVVQLDRTKVKRISKGGQSFDDMLRAKELSAQFGISGVVSLKLDVDLEISRIQGILWRYRMDPGPAIDHRQGAGQAGRGFKRPGYYQPDRFGRQTIG
jgi:hypothetical protein